LAVFVAVKIFMKRLNIVERGKYVT